MTEPYYLTYEDAALILCAKIDLIMATVVGTLPKPVKMDSHGILRVGNTRVSLDLVINEFNRGADAAEIQLNYDALSLAEVHAAIAYYLHNKAEVDAYLVEQEKLEAETRERIEKRFPPDEMRKKVLARKRGEDPNWK